MVFFVASVGWSFPVSTLHAQSTRCIRKWFAKIGVGDPIKNHKDKQEYDSGVIAQHQCLTSLKLDAE